jgi:tRNA G18 (ribose-2'-O)-methylase SpoU
VVRGYFGVGVERISKAMNMGSIFRSAHAFGASFVFTVAAVYVQERGRLADTSNAPGSLPFYSFPDIASMLLPKDCSLVGVELTEDAVELPSFRHPRQAAYILGPERGSLSPGMTGRCEFVIKIPTKFCVNVGIAAAIVMYDRLLNLGKFAQRPGIPGGRSTPLPEPVFGPPRFRRKIDEFLMAPPTELPEID